MKCTCACASVRGLHGGAQPYWLGSAAAAAGPAGTRAVMVVSDS